MWIDTCCIDKSSSAELQESINSMYRCYRKAFVCYVYLRDHKPGDLDLDCCRWTTRCWTLQELIAPSTVLFHADDWSVIGSKEKFSAHCAKATGIAGKIVRQPKLLDEASVAQKMSWASYRKCTRIEDQAYSLMGLFGINMPMLYGEGERAFIRLQEEIVKTTFDMSIFAWTNPIADSSSCCGLLAPSPLFFDSCRNLTSRSSFEDESPYSITNLGMQLHTRLIPRTFEYDLFQLPLVNVQSESYIRDKILAGKLTVHVKRLSPGSPHFARVDSHKLYKIPFDYDPGKRTSQFGHQVQKIYIRQFPILSESYNITYLHKIHIRSICGSMEGGSRQDFEIVRFWPKSDWLELERMFFVAPETVIARLVVWYKSSLIPRMEDVRVLVLDVTSRGRRPRFSILYKKPHYIPLDTADEDVEAKLTQVIDDLDSEIGSNGFFWHQTKDMFRDMIRADLVTHLLDGRLTLDIDVHLVYKLS